MFALSFFFLETQLNFKAIKVFFFTFQTDLVFTDWKYWDTLLYFYVLFECTNLVEHFLHTLKLIPMLIKYHTKLVCLNLDESQPVFCFATI